MIGFEARISGPSLETDFFYHRQTDSYTESRIEACCALPKKGAILELLKETKYVPNVSHD